MTRRAKTIGIGSMTGEDFGGAADTVLMADQACGSTGMIRG